jgi:hypothetical protein
MGGRSEAGAFALSVGASAARAGLDQSQAYAIVGELKGSERPSKRFVDTTFGVGGDIAQRQESSAFLV